MTPLPPHPMCILVIDDDHALCQALGKQLRNIGYKVLTAPHFAPALKILETEPQIDLLLIDIVMPGSVNGLALSNMARLRRPGLKVVYMTGHDISEFGELLSGPMLRKPIDADVLIQTIARVLSVPPS